MFLVMWPEVPDPRAVRSPMPLYIARLLSELVR